MSFFAPNAENYLGYSSGLENDKTKDIKFKS